MKNALKKKNLDFGETKEQEKKTRQKKYRVKDLTKLNLEQGKLYKFNGRYRNVYRTKKPQMLTNEEYYSIYKIRKGDFIMFFGADLWRTSSRKKKYVRKEDLEKVKKKLVKSNYKITEVTPFSFRWVYYKHTKENSMYTISFLNKEEEYSGRLYIGHGEKFGWINIIGLSKGKIIEQFEKVIL